MNKLKRILCLIMALAMIMALFAGCGSSDTEEETVEEEVAEEETVEEEEEEEEEEEIIEEEEEEEAEEVSSGSSLPLCDETTTLTMLLSWSSSDAGGLIEDMEDITGIGAAEELTNVIVEFSYASSDTYSDIFALTISGGDIPDMLSQAARTYPNGLLTGIEDGVLANIYPYLEEYAPEYLEYLNLSEDSVNQATLSEGVMGAMYMLREVGDATTGLVIRQDWLDELGYDMPVTYEDYEEVLTAFKTEYGCSSPYLLHSGLQTATFFTGGFGTSGFTTGTNTQQYMQSYYQVDGVVHSSLIEDGYKEYVELMNKWYEEGLIGLDFLSLSSTPFTSDYMQEFYNSETGLWHGRADAIDSYTSSITAEGAAVAAAPAAVENEGDTYHFVDTHYISLNTSVAFSADSENLELAIQWINFWFTDEGAMIFCFGVEDDTYRLDDNGEIELTEVCTENEMGMPASLILTFLTVEGKWPGLQYAALENIGTAELAAEAVSVWSDGDEAYIIPSMDVLSEYLTEYNTLYTDISTYAMETISAFIVGNKDMSEWDSYVEELESIGISRCIEIMQETYDSYAG